MEKKFLVKGVFIIGVLVFTYPMWGIYTAQMGWNSAWFVASFFRGFSLTINIRYMVAGGLICFWAHKTYPKI